MRAAAPPRSPGASTVGFCCPLCGGVLRSDDFRFDVGSGAVIARGQCVVLPRREAAVLEALVSRRGRFVSRNDLYALVFDADDDIDMAVIESHVSKLRRKLRPLGVSILSERFKGYQMPLAAREAAP